MKLLNQFRQKKSPLAPNGRNGKSYQQAYPGADLETVLELERARADRTGQVFSQIIFDCQSMDDACIRSLWELIHRRVRCTDEVGWVSARSIGVVLPDTPAEGAWKLSYDIAELVDSPKCCPACNVYVYPSGRPHDAS
jgi:hypothetical protein